MVQLLGKGMSHDQALVALLGIVLPAITYTFLAALTETAAKTATNAVPKSTSTPDPV